MLFTSICHAAMSPEDVSALGAVWTREQGHVLDHAEKRSGGFLEHVDAFDGIFESDVLGSGDYYCT